MSQDENELMELRRANCALALEREQLLKRIAALEAELAQWRKTLPLIDTRKESTR